ncbi:homeobox KN domain-containing protein [Radiomyces spectabilis]|uniref:homeobox KN domain-containing protein n=1 Tax=Radiomyces spectabilis TaxID=64574 RepID=UPI00221EDB57|nr:homeobox KN domain-containing protein [Radiomyces spectabilis]KAI8388841.1 homeobox KN domain-containing protein [Radiomyces spectabilis]
MFCHNPRTLLSQKQELRTFQPIILFHDHQNLDQSCEAVGNRRNRTTSTIHHRQIQYQKQKVDGMLESNRKLWCEVIQSTRQQERQLPATVYLSRPSSTVTRFKHIAPYVSDTLSSPLHRSVEVSKMQSISEYSPNYYGHQTKEVDDVLSHTSASSSSSVMVHAVDNDIRIEIQQENKNAGVTCTDNHRKRRGNLPKPVTAVLKQWLVQHSRHPYPTEVEKLNLQAKTNLTLNQISNWFINARRRLLPALYIPDGNGAKRKPLKGRLRSGNKVFPSVSKDIKA